MLETKFAAGAPGIDMVLADPGYANYWYESGWTQALDGLPGLAQINADMSIPSLKPDLISSDGKQMAIPYYNGTVLFAYNKALLSKYDVAPPTTWAEFTAACTKMKKAGLDYPFAAFWDADFGIVFYNFLAHCAVRGHDHGVQRGPPRADLRHQPDRHLGTRAVAGMVLEGVCGAGHPGVDLHQRLQPVFGWKSRLLIG